ncbi:hypothetical protein V1525DRAFT_428299 [Lipomyces kononenkoae]|uniref:Uncharacterized protein n=1 Tax=Lipomyces kononenkoae TaxID=34357 RepID=A0ACC3ST00_LIPKO
MLKQASYLRALQFLQGNEAGRQLDVHLSYTSFRYLEEQAQVLCGDAKYPRTLRVTIYTIPTALHGEPAPNIELCIMYSVRDILIQHNKRELVKYIHAVGESTYMFTDDLGRPSSNTPDGGLKYYRFGRSELVMIIEVGVSEAYLQLKADIELWLNSSQSPNGILLWLSEKPRFGIPSFESRSAYAALQHMFKSAMEQAGRDARLGPYIFNEHRWFGTLETASLEVEKICIHISLDERAVDDIRLEPVCLATDFVMEVLSGAAQDTAVARFSDYVNPREQ